MNILFISAVLPYPLHSGGQVRIYNLLKRLSKDHAVTLYAFIRNEEEKAYLASLNFCAKVVPIYRGRAWQIPYVFRALTSSWSLLYATYENRELKSQLEQELSLQKFDCIHLEPGYVFASIPKTSIPIVVSEHNIEHCVYEGYAQKQSFFLLKKIFQWDVEKMKRWEKTIWNTVSAVNAVSEEDATYVRQHSTQKNVTVVPNGVDINYFTFSPKKTMETTSLRFLYVGNFAWMQNSDAIEFILTTIWGSVRQKYPGATFMIVGKHFPKRLKQYCDESIHVVDSVDDIRDAYRTADILLAPIRIGGGTRYKILEAMAHGLPVITSTLGASGLGVVNKKELCIADTAPAVLHCIESLSNDAVRSVMVKSSRERIEKYYSWEGIAKLQESTWKSV